MYQNNEAMSAVRYYNFTGALRAAHFKTLLVTSDPGSLVALAPLKRKTGLQLRKRETSALQHGFGAQ